MLYSYLEKNTFPVEETLYSSFVRTLPTNWRMRSQLLPEDATGSSYFETLGKKVLLSQNQRGQYRHAQYVRYGPFSPMEKFVTRKQLSVKYMSFIGRLVLLMTMLKKEILGKQNTLK